MLRFKLLEQDSYQILRPTTQNSVDTPQIHDTPIMYIYDLATIIPLIIATYYEKYTWVKWKIEINNTDNTENFLIPQNETCFIQLQKLLMPIPQNQKQKIEQNQINNQIMECNQTQFIQRYKINKYTTKFTIPGGKFRMPPNRQKRSIVHTGWVTSNIFQWDNWQWQDDGTKRNTWYTITIIHGPNRTITKTIHFILENIQSYLTGIKDVMLDKSLHTKNTIIAYHSGAKYCERIATAKIYMYNALHTNKRENLNCFPYYNNTEICEIKNKPKCRYAVGSMQTALQKPGILPDIEENKPSIAYSNACFLPNNYTIYGNATRIDNNHRTRREVTLAVVFLISILIGTLVAGIIEAQMKTYNDRINDKLEKLETNSPHNLIKSKTKFHNYRNNKLN